MRSLKENAVRFSAIILLPCTVLLLLNSFSGASLYAFRDFAFLILVGCFLIPAYFGKRLLSHNIRHTFFLRGRWRLLKFAYFSLLLGIVIVSWVFCVSFF